MELKGKKINFLGDSITEGHGTSSSECCFTSILKKEYGLAEARNYGIGGTRIAPQAKPSQDERLDQNFCGRYACMDDDADIVVVFGGTNDFGHGDAPLGSVGDNTNDTFCGACNMLYSGLRSKYPYSFIIVMTPTHRCNEDNPRGDGYKKPGATLKEYVHVIKDIASKYSFPVLDLFEGEAAYELKEEYFPDGLHPDDKGHKVLARLIAEFIENLYESHNKMDILI